jgi:spore coat protein U-like protein
MYCHKCGATFSTGTPVCSRCGNPTIEQNSDESSSNIATLPPASKPYDPYRSKVHTFYGEQTTQEGPQNVYAPPPPQDRTTSGPLKAFFASIIVLLLLSGAFGGWLLLAHKTAAPSTPLTHKPTATPQPTAPPTFQFLPGTWTECAVEDATCSFSGAMAVAYGANGSYKYATKTDGTVCSNNVFGDPLSGAKKACYIETIPSTTNAWVQCAAENATCSFNGVMTVAFGANGSYTYATKTNGTTCTDDVFGDPLYGTAKFCYLLAPPIQAATWTTCATENATCTFKGLHEVAFGANGKYLYGSFTNGTACTKNVFGNPADNDVKTCYYQ